MGIINKLILLIVGCLAVLMFFAFPAHAGWLFADVPKGTEIKDPYLEQLFAPEFPYEWVKAIETKEGKRYVVIKVKWWMTKGKEIEYQSKTLRKKNISIKRVYNPHTGALMIGEIKLLRKVSDVPYVVEYCMAEKSGNTNIAWRDGRYLVIVINKDFGKKFKRLIIYPEKEAGCSNPPHVGKYPGSISLGCYKRKSQIVFTYVTKDEPKKIYDFYRDKLKKHYDNIGFRFPESRWEYPSMGFGMRISYGGIEVVDEIISAVGKKAPLPPGGVVFEITIFRGASDAEALIQGYSFIKIYYETNQSIIKESIKRMK